MAGAWRDLRAAFLVIGTVFFMSWALKSTFQSRVFGNTKHLSSWRHSLRRPSISRGTGLFHNRNSAREPMRSERKTRAYSGISGGGNDKFYITTPIYYVNDKPHIGHAYTTVACDIIARYRRLHGDNVMFVTGTDEHGQKVQQSAEKAGKTPQEFVDEVSDKFRQLADDLQCSHDVFIRTTEDRHKKAAQYLWETLEKKGQIYLGHYEGWYSVRDEAYYKESELVDGKAPTGAEVEWVVKEPSYFFKLSEWTQPLLDFYEKNPDFLQPSGKRDEVVNFVTKGLQDLSISRTTFDWGVPVPTDADGKHVMYVWIDALTNYLTAAGYPDESGNPGEFWPASMHVIGKDILRFHAIYWPAFLMAAGLEPPKSVFAHGWWMRDGQKMSKSIGNVINPNDLLETYGVDQTRYFLASSVAFGEDGDYSDELMLSQCNGVLANGMGNLAQRSLSLVFKNCEKTIPAIPTPDQLTEEDNKLLESASGLLKMSDDVMRASQLHRYCFNIHLFIKDANAYIDQQAPWSLKKTDPERMRIVLWVVLESVRKAAILLQPVMPSAMNKLLDQLSVSGEKRTFEHIATSPLEANEIAKPVPVFPRIELESATPA
mmetsp:Transcript_21699/g.32301  ORF Transcript_21699/g.32301 Transcript_21699/m.32301 type:complete len:600 (+) Transcript_21699:298-2097(+)